MQLPTDTIEHNGNEFTVSYNELFVSAETGEVIERTEPNRDNEPYRDEPVSIPRFEDTPGTTDVQYIKRAHYYVKYIINIEDPPLDATVHANALRHVADEFEALEANGWEITNSDSVHITFEKEEGIFSP